MTAYWLQILWEKRFEGDVLNDCLVSVDCVDFEIPFLGKTFHSHKFKFSSGLRYEAAVSIAKGDLVWINGPYEPGKWNDVMIFRNALMTELGEGERVEADDGYIGEAPNNVKCPKSISNHACMEKMQAFVRRRHETINKRFKQWGVLRQFHRGDLKKHTFYFRLCAIVTQLAIENGEPLFSVEYQDPDFDNLYFDDDNEDDDDE